MYSLKLKIISHKKLNDIFTYEILEKYKQDKHVENELSKNKFVMRNFNVKKKKRIFTVLKSPHVNKKFREHFIMSYHRYNVVIKHEKIKYLLYFNVKLKKMMTQGALVSSKIILN
jgi:ribosomal protein S10